MKCDLWTDENILFLKDNCSRMRYSEISKIINKSEGAIQTKLHRIGLCPHKRLTHKDEDIVKELYLNKITIREIAEKLNRPIKTIYSKVSRLGLIKKKRPNKKWMDDESFLLDNYKCMSDEELAQSLNRTISSVQNRKFILGLCKNMKWTEEDIYFLKKNYLTMHYSDIAKKLNRHIYSIQSKICNLGLSEDIRWSQSEEDILRENYSKISVEDISKKLNRKVQAITSKASKLGLIESKKWTTKDISFLKENYSKMSRSELSKKLNRSKVSIQVKKGRLGLIEIHKWNNDEETFIKENYSEMSNIEIAKKLNHSVSMISNKLSKLGLKRPKEWTSNYMRDLFIGKTCEERYGKEKADEMRKNASIKFSGEGNPNFGKTTSEKTKEKMSKANMGNIPLNLEILHANMKGKGNPMYGKFGKDHPGYINGKAYEPYPETWHIGIKRAIRKRDNQICMNCWIHREKLKRALSVHHIDYNKEICIKENLISLCPKCHALTNLNRKHWTKFFQSLLSERYGYEYSESGEIIIKYQNLSPIKKK